MKIFLIFSLLSFSLTLFSEAKSQDNKSVETDVKTLSKVMGHLIGKNIKNTAIPLDEKALLEGLQESFSGKTLPLSEKQCEEILTNAHEKAHKELAFKNLKEAETFLQNNSKANKIVSLEKGNLQYRIEKKGKGNKVQSYNRPLIRYKGKYLDGTVFTQTIEPERVCLDETIPGFKKAVEGMREGEIRTVFIHPDLSYGESGSLLPNALLTYEIEVLQADTSDKNFNLHENKLISSQK